jgi:uncharacterized protein (TIGR03083 family)
MTAADRDPPVLPSVLRDRVLAVSLRARGAGRPVPDTPEISAREAYSRAASAFHAALCSLSEDDWRTPVLRDLDVQGLVGHLIGVEDDVRRCLAGDQAAADVSHIESTQAAAVAQAGRPPALTRADWRLAADRTLDLVRSADPGTRVALHGMRLSLDTLLVIRAFELWTHENDIRRAAGWDASAPDASTLRLMTELAARLLPHAAAQAGLGAPVDVHLVLTGPGGGTWDVTVGGDAPAPAAAPVPAPAAVSIVTGAVGFCQLVANRIAPANLDVHVTGDPGQATAVLAAASTLALD